MKLKLVMSNAETGEVLHEETNLDFAMMAYGRKIEEGVDMRMDSLERARKKDTNKAEGTSEKEGEQA